MTDSDFVVTVKFDDGTSVEIGGGSELYIIPGEGQDNTAILDEDRLALIARLKAAEKVDAA